jgi:hypothetical protein
MQAPTVARALAAWERGIEGGVVERSLQLFAMTRPDAPLAALADVSLGERDDALFELRKAMFGPQATGRLACVGCGEPQEISLRLDDLRVGKSDREAAEIPLTCGGYRLRLRLLNSRDLLEAASTGDTEAARNILIERCVLSAERDNRDIAPRDLPAAVVSEVAKTLTAADAEADLVLNVACSACGQRSSIPFDIALFLWEEVDAWAERLLREVHALAAYYGWSERDILELSPVRRRRYLELAAG